MSEPSCPICDLSMTPPGRVDGASQQSTEFDLDCPGCGRPLTWFAESGNDGRWIRDEEAEARIRMEQGPDA